MSRYTLMFLIYLLFGVQLFSQTLEIHQLNIGQGDAAVIIARNPGGTIAKTVLLDGGLKRSRNVIMSFLESKNITTIDYMINSHFHGDHISGLTAILDDLTMPTLGTLTVSEVFDRGDTKHTGTSGYKSITSGKFRLFAATHNRQELNPGMEFVLYDDPADTYDIIMTCIAVNGLVWTGGTTPVNLITTTNPNENDLSTAFQITFGEFIYFTGGDIGGKNGAQPGTCSGGYNCSYTDIETEVATIVDHNCAFKVSHHGSRCSTNNYFLNELNPTIAVIPSGKHGRFKHPKQEVLNSLNEYSNLEYYYITADANYYARNVSNTSGVTKGEFIGGHVSITVPLALNPGDDIASKSKFRVETVGLVTLNHSYTCDNGH